MAVIDIQLNDNHNVCFTITYYNVETLQVPSDRPARTSRRVVAAGDESSGRTRPRYNGIHETPKFLDSFEN